MGNVGGVGGAGRQFPDIPAAIAPIEQNDAPPFDGGTPPPPLQQELYPNQRNPDGTPYQSVVGPGFPQAETVEPGIGDPPPPLEEEDVASEAEIAFLGLCKTLLEAVEELREEVRLLRERPPTVNLVLKGDVDIERRIEVPKPAREINNPPEVTVEDQPKQKFAPGAEISPGAVEQGLLQTHQQASGAAKESNGMEETSDLKDLQKQLGGKKAWVDRRAKAVDDAKEKLRVVQAEGGETEDAFADLKAAEAKLDKLNGEIASLEQEIAALEG